MKIEKRLIGARKLWFPFKLIYFFAAIQLLIIVGFFISLFKWRLPNIIKFQSND